MFPRGQLAMCGDILGCRFLGWEGWGRALRPGMSLHILQCTGQVPPAKKFPAQAVSSAEIGIPGQVSGVSECVCVCMHACACVCSLVSIW